MAGEEAEGDLGKATGGLNREISLVVVQIGHQLQPENVLMKQLLIQSLFGSFLIPKQNMLPIETEKSSPLLIEGASQMHNFVQAKSSLVKL